MDTPMKPVRIPNELTSKYAYTWIFVVYLTCFMVGMFIAALQLPDYLVVVSVILLILSFLAILCYPLAFDKIVFPEGVQVRRLGRVIQQLSISDFKMLCAVGNDREQYLCLSVWNVEELAERREKILQRGHFTRQDLPFMKKNPDWQERFAREYLLNPKEMLRNSPILWLTFDPVVVVYLRRLYPQLPYVDLRNRMMGRATVMPSNQIPLTGGYYRMDEEGIHILGELGKRELRCIPAERIKTILRVDRFVSVSKSEPVYGCYLVASELHLEELAYRGKRKGGQKWKRKIIDELPEAEEMYAAEFHFSGLFTWNWRTATDCHISYTPEKEILLRQLYPHAQWVDYSKQWQ